MVFGFYRNSGYLGVLLISFLYLMSPLGFCKEDGYLGVADILLLASRTEGGYSALTSTHMLGFYTEMLY